MTITWGDDAERGMDGPLLPSLTSLDMTPIRALLLTLMTALVVVVPAPAAQAAWSGQRCTVHAGSGFTICAQVNTVRTGNSYQVNSIQLCTDGYPSEVFHIDKFRGTTSTAGVFTGANGAPKGWFDLVEADRDSCTYTSENDVMGAGACYKVEGRADLSGGLPDEDFTIRGNIVGGAC